jgi:hypothetical protein
MSDKQVKTNFSDATKTEIDKELKKVCEKLINN